MKSTSKDVARRAGLSQSTVSRVINGKDGVSPELRTLVYQAMEDVGYIPNALARSLITQRTQVIGLLVSNITNPFFAQLTESVTEHARGRGYSVMLVVIPVRARDDRGAYALQARMLAEHRVAGLILTSTPVADKDSLLKLSSPFPIVGIRPGKAPFDTVSIDHRGGTRIATQHLINQGRRHLGFIGGRSDSMAGAAHQAGFEVALRKPENRNVHTAFVSHGEFTYESAYERTLEIVCSRVQFDGLVVAADTMALGCIDALTDAGIAVPTDVSIVGFDDIPAASYRSVQLTTVRGSANLVAKKAVDFLIERAEGYDGPPRMRSIASSLVVRRSCGHP